MKVIGFIIGCICFPILLQAHSASLIIISEKTVNTLRYWPLDGKSLPFYTLAKELAKTSDSSFIWQCDLKEPVIMQFVLDNGKSFQAYLCPGSRDTVCIKREELNFRGSNTEYNSCLEGIDRTRKYAATFSSVRTHELDSINNFDDFIRITEEKKTFCLSLMKNKELNSDFIQQQTAHLNCIFVHLFYRKILSLYMNKSLTDDWTKNLDKKLQFDFQNPDLFAYPDYEPMIRLNVMIDYFILNKNLPSAFDRDKLNTFLFQRYFEKLQGEYLEYAWACLLYNSIFQNDFSIEIPGLYTRFSTVYPGSPYHKFLASGVKDIRSFHNKSNTNNRIFFLSCDSTVRTLEDVVKPFRGKVVYVDLWATWCSPCQKMFTFEKTCRKMTSGLDVVYLYISIDRPELREKWEKMVCYYQLEGYHVLAGKKLAESFYTSLGNTGMLAIPQFVIIDPDGKVVVEKAASPKEPEKLINQLKKYMK